MPKSLNRASLVSFPVLTCSLYNLNAAFNSSILPIKFPIKPLSIFLLNKLIAKVAVETTTGNTPNLSIIEFKIDIASAPPDTIVVKIPLPPVSANVFCNSNTLALNCCVAASIVFIYLEFSCAEYPTELREFSSAFA